MKRETRITHGVTVPHPHQAKYHREPEFRFPQPEKPLEDSMKGWTILGLMVGVALVVALVRLYFVWKTGAAS